MHKDIEDYVRGCDSCQRNKISRQSKVTELAPHDIPKEPWELISVDIISPLPMSHEYNAILAIVDHYTKQIHLILTMMELTSGKLVELYQDHIWKLHSLPHVITSDRGPQFASILMQDLCKGLGIV